MGNSPKLLNKDFVLIAIGQIISLFGNSILRFALPLHLLKITGSATIFGGVMAISLLPLLFLTPIGGVTADRLNKRNIMVVLDVIASAVVFTLSLFLNSSNIIVPITVVMVALAMINCFYSPAVSSSMPLIVGKENLLRANSITGGISSMAQLMGPLVGGTLYALFGIQMIVYTTAACLLFSAIMELFIVIPKAVHQVQGFGFAVFYQDFKDAIQYLKAYNPIIFQYIAVACLFNMTLTPLMSIGLPAIINLKLQMPEGYYAVAQSLISIGTFVGAASTAVFGSRIKQNKWYLILLAIPIFLLPMCGALLIPQNSLLTYCILVFFSLLVMVACNFILILLVSDVQRRCPVEHVGKVMSIVVLGYMCAQPIGNALYGVAYDQLPSALIFFVTAGILFLLTMRAKKILK